MGRIRYDIEEQEGGSGKGGNLVGKVEKSRKSRFYIRRIKYCRNFLPTEESSCSNKILFEINLITQEEISCHRTKYILSEKDYYLSHEEIPVRGRNFLPQE